MCWNCLWIQNKMFPGVLIKGPLKNVFFVKKLKSSKKKQLFFDFFFTRRKNIYISQLLRLNSPLFSNDFPNFSRTLLPTLKLQILNLCHKNIASSTILHKKLDREYQNTLQKTIFLCFASDWFKLIIQKVESLGRKLCASLRRKKLIY